MRSRAGSHRAARPAAGLVTSVGSVLLLVLSGCGGGTAAAESPELLAAMKDEVRAMHGYAIEPETFDRYLGSSHEGARRLALAGGADPNSALTQHTYRSEVYRRMLQCAFDESRTDLTDVLTRAYMAAVQSQP